MEYSIPQRSVLSPKHYVLYTKPLGDVIQTHRLQHHFYADDTQLYLSFKPKDDVAQALTLIENWLKDVESWTHQNMPMLIMTIESTPTVGNLGVLFDSTISMEQQGNIVFISEYTQLCKIAG